jgi:polysaccharide chain length determinant protein (PEP-CTERM system associated)
MQMKLHPEQFIKLLIHEAFQYRTAVVSIFIVVNLSLLALGLLWQKEYTASTTILVEDKKIIQPLMQGAAVTTDVADRARVFKDVIFGRKIMNQILEDGGWLKDDPTPTEQEKIIDNLIRKTKITNIGRDLIKIEYKDVDPERAFKTTKKYADLFIAESLTAKAAESKAAFDFIDKETEEYHGKLSKAEDQLKEFRSANLDARPGSDADIGTRLSALQLRIEQATQDLKEMETKKKSIEKQLSGEAEVATVLSREGQYRARIGELQSQLETLRLNYHDTYPDITRIKHQIEDLNQAIAEDRQRREEAKAAGKITIDENVVNNPMYQQLKRDLSQTNINIDTLTARIAEARRELQMEVDLGKRVHGGEATLAELTRDYQVNRDIYQDLLKRRENARVSVNLDRENQGLNVKIQEPAVLPIQPSGFRFIHFIIGGFILGIAAPLGLLYAKIELDPRVTAGWVIFEKCKLPLLAEVPHLWSPPELRAVRRGLAWQYLTIIVTMLGIAAIVSLHIRNIPL